MRSIRDTAAASAEHAGAGDEVQLVKVYGRAHRGCHLVDPIDTQFAVASGTKGLTALTVVSLIEKGRLELATTARSVLDGHPAKFTRDWVREMTRPRSAVPTESLRYGRGF